MNPFSVVDNSIDIVVAFFFGVTIFYACKYVWLNHLTTQGRILYAAIIIISTLQIHQTITQLFLKDFANFRIWDIINYLTVFLFMGLTHRMSIKEQKT